MRSVAWILYTTSRIVLNSNTDELISAHEVFFYGDTEKNQGKKTLHVDILVYECEIQIPQMP